MHEPARCGGGPREASMRDETVFYVRILDTTQIRRLIAFSSVTDLTRQRFNDSTMHKLSLAEGFAMRRGNWGGSKN